VQCRRSKRIRQSWWVSSARRSVGGKFGKKKRGGKQLKEFKEKYEDGSI
jgi:hypothetical protein